MPPHMPYYAQPAGQAAQPYGGGAAEAAGRGAAGQVDRLGRPKAFARDTNPRDVPG